MLVTRQIGTCGKQLGTFTGPNLPIPGDQLPVMTQSHPKLHHKRKKERKNERMKE